VLLESGTIVSPGWLDKLLSALDADPRHGLASPSTNQAWNQLAVFPNAHGDDADIARTAAAAEQRFGKTWRSLAPLWDVGDFCLVVRRAVIDAAGLADEAYGQGPCWEMDYAACARRAGFISVWAQGAYVFRHPFTARRRREEARLLEASRHRYQDKFCGLRLSGARTTYARHCRGEACQHFASTAASGMSHPGIEAHPLAPSCTPPAVPASLRPVLARQPLVSCIMPTSDRPDWLAQAICYFQRQGYPNRELVIVDASAGSAKAAIPDDPSVRYHRIRSRTAVGAMRNIACGLARGDIVVHWDDDDWYGPNRIAAQVQPILDDRADITALTDTLFFDLNRWQFWRCAPRLHQRLFVLDAHGGTLAFRKSLFGARCRYPEVSLAEDASFLHCAVQQGARLARLPSDGLFVYLRHGGNAWTFPCGTYLDPGGWRCATEPDGMAKDRAFYAARSQARMAAAPQPLAAEVAEAMGRVAIGVHVHAEPDRLRATLEALEAHTAPGFEVLLLPDAPDQATRMLLAGLGHIAQSATEVPQGAAACFNRLANRTTADTLLLLESGTIVAPGWLDKLLAALFADPRHGLACPSTNHAWNRLAVFPKGRADHSDIARTAAEADRRFGERWQNLAPLWDVGDFCLAVRRSVVDAVGPADETYGEGPCWEMDYAVRAARARFDSVWAQGAYVFRYPFTARRQRDEASLFEASRRHYQDKFCGLRLSGARTTYARHCRGGACSHFAVPAPIAVAAPAVVSQRPLVSCIMPTANRRRFVPDAIERFLEQDYRGAELVIMDDGEDPVEDLVPTHKAVRYLRTPRHRSLGLKRNAACEAARGEIILHWDDDDWYASDRIRIQVEGLIASNAELCGIDRALLFDARAQAAWEYVYPRGGTPWVYGATLCYRRSYWLAHPFDDLQIGEDTRFAAAAREGQLSVLPDNRFFVGLVHPANTSPKQVRDPRWRPCDVATVLALTGPDWPKPYGQR
jgi:glycosyltransferase involved in cell wall biosynthesis